MAAPTFEWNATKAVANLKRHSVSFEEAATTFQDPLARLHDDPGHSAAEYREIIVGHSRDGFYWCLSRTAGVTFV